MKLYRHAVGGKMERVRSGHREQDLPVTQPRLLPVRAHHKARLGVEAAIRPGREADVADASNSGLLYPAGMGTFPWGGGQKSRCH
ncbi:hypothetical protein GCM10007870_07270 [Gluconobacter kondonii]|uniref:Uncharacterized protein n=1 Tax=Gluconobacter kondonii TaxID=941463 RepID=A0ABQ5WPW1_9PROT|nr:hypothetical protein AA3266_1670 [Gluconobacter kondonii NBRC 3266]GLQ65143.1 hypothetical protein GCM10007870_07270 [Gluconobacter kondonii]